MHYNVSMSKHSWVNPQCQRLLHQCQFALHEIHYPLIPTPVSILCRYIVHRHLSISERGTSSKPQMSSPTFPSGPRGSGALDKAR